MGVSVENEFQPRSKKTSTGSHFSQESKAISHPLLLFNNNNNVIQATSHKHLGIILDTRLSFEKHLKISAM